MKLQKKAMRSKSQVAVALVALGTSEAPSGDTVNDSEPAGSITSNSVGTQTNLNATEALEEDNEKYQKRVFVEEAILAKMSLRVVKRSFDSLQVLVALLC